MTEVLGINQDVVYTEVEDEVVLMAPDDGAYHGLNKVGAEIWNLLVEAPMHLRAIIMHLQQTYALRHDEAEKDAVAFIDMMRDKNFIMSLNNPLDD